MVHFVCELIAEKGRCETIPCLKTQQPRLTLSQPKPMRFEEGEDMVRLTFIDDARQEKQADPAARPMQHQLPRQ